MHFARPPFMSIVDLVLILYFKVHFVSKLFQTHSNKAHYIQYSPKRVSLHAQAMLPMFGFPTRKTLQVLIPTIHSDTYCYVIIYYCA